jgi:hypothetical protein
VIVDVGVDSDGDGDGDVAVDERGRQRRCNTIPPTARIEQKGALSSSI